MSAFLIGITAIAEAVDLDERETLRRIETGELRVRYSGTLPVIAREVLERIAQTPHFPAIEH